MNFFTTSAQIAQDYNVSHQEVLDTINKLPYDDLREAHIQVLDLPDLIIAQLTETGTNAVVFHLPKNDENRDKLTKFRELLFQNRHPNVTDSPIIQPSQSPQSTANGPVQIDPATRERIKQEIAAGQWDEAIKTDTISGIHRKIVADTGKDPGYQNCRVYITNRKKVANINV